MTTRRWARTAATVALTAAALAVPAAPAAGAPAAVRILSVSAENVAPGDTVRVRFRATNTGSASERAVVVVGGGLRCTDGCRAEPRLGPGRSRDLQATLVAPATAAGQVSGLNISVAVRLGGANSYDFRMVYVHGSGVAPGAGGPSTGAQKPAPGVDRVSGRVRDDDGKAVRGAALTVRDSAGHEYRATSDAKGRFSVRPSAGKPIVAGRLAVVATRKGYRTARTAVEASAGRTATVQVTLAAVAAPTTSSPSPESATAETTAPVASLAAAVDERALDTVSDDGSSSWPFTVLGAVLVALGLVALALMVARRRNTRDEPEEAVAAPSLGDAPTAVLRAVPPAGGLRGGPAR